jgi:phosphoenolpyruvate-protein kinase (PTS system EI component)
VEVIIDGAVLIAGPIDSSAGVPDDEASDRAIQEVVKNGAYSKSEAGSFKFAYYWDTLEHMKDYIEERWSDSTHLPKRTLDQAARLVNESQSLIQIRIQSYMKIVRYKKLDK